MPILETLSTPQIGLAAAALLLGAFVQGAVGFAYGMISIPLLVWIGLPLPLAVGVVGATVTVQTGSGAWRFRKHIVWRDLPGLMITRLAGVPLGLLAMGWLTAGGAGLMKQGVGVVLLSMVALTALLRPAPRKNVSRRWVVPVGLSSGVLSGGVGMGGPPVVLYAVAHDWSTERHRGFLWALFFTLMPVQLGLMVWGFGADVAWAVAGGLLLTPGVIWAGHAGARFGSRWSRKQARRVTLGVLVVLAAVSILGPWLG